MTDVRLSPTELRVDSRAFGRVDGPLLLRTFETTARRLRRRLLRLVDDLTAHRIDVSQFTRGADQVVRTEFGIAYSLGALSIDPFHVLTLRDIRVINAEFEQERQFLRAFGRDIAGGEFVLNPVQRAGLYLQALRGMFEMGRMHSLPEGPFVWQLGTTEHCLECLDASVGGPYQRTTYSGLGLPVLPGIPGSGDVCRGLSRCGCQIKLRGLPIPNEQMQSEVKNVLVRVLHDTS